MSGRPDLVTWLGHATAVIDLDGARVVTDPLLSDRLVHLRRFAPPAAVPDRVDAALVSHLHADHLHAPSLRRVAPATVVAPPGAGRYLPAGLPVVEVDEGDEVEIGPLRVRAVHAEHDGRRAPGRRGAAPALGYVVTGSRSVYFAGDTARFPAMAELAPARLDLALLPVWGWGPGLGPGHLDPQDAAKALALIRPRRAVPIHWGTYAPAWTRRRPAPGFMVDPPRDFARLAGRLAPGSRVVVLQPGEATPLEA